MPSSAPSCLQYAIFSSVDAAATTRAPSAFPSSIAAEPTPPFPSASGFRLAGGYLFRGRSPDKPEIGPSYCELPIQMSLSGDFNGFYSFLLQLEKLPRIYLEILRALLP